MSEKKALRPSLPPLYTAQDDYSEVFPLWRKLKNIINMCIGPPQRFLMDNGMQLFCFCLIENGGCVARVEEG
jgi:hypothetical protein